MEYPHLEHMDVHVYSIVLVFLVWAFFSDTFITYLIDFNRIHITMNKDVIPIDLTIYILLAVFYPTLAHYLVILLHPAPITFIACFDITDMMSHDQLSW